MRLCEDPESSEWNCDGIRSCPEQRDFMQEKGILRDTYFESLPESYDNKSFIQINLSWSLLLHSPKNTSWASRVLISLQDIKCCPSYKLRREIRAGDREEAQDKRVSLRLESKHSLVSKKDPASRRRKDLRQIKEGKSPIPDLPRLLRTSFPITVHTRVEKGL